MINKFDHNTKFSTRDKKEEKKRIVVIGHFFHIQYTYMESNSSTHIRRSFPFFVVLMFSAIKSIYEMTNSDFYVIILPQICYNSISWNQLLRQNFISTHVLTA